MSILNFPSKDERERGPSRLERTLATLQEQIADMRTDDGMGIMGFTSETNLITETVADISVTGVTDTNNQVGLGRLKLQTISNQLNNYLTAEARPFVVSVHEIPSVVPSLPDDDFVQNSLFVLRVTALA